MKKHKQTRSDKLRSLPYGYRWALGVDGRPHIVVCPEEAVVVKLIFNLAAQGLSEEHIADLLNRTGISASEEA